MFHSARLQLTAWYLLIIMLISITFSMVIFKFYLTEIERFERVQRFRIERRLQENENALPVNQFRGLPPPIPVSPDLIDEVKNRILFILMLINGGIFIFSGGFGFILAGRTLKPIKDMIDEQNRFISDASHELRTPLTSLKTAFEVYLRNNQPTISEAKLLITESIQEVNILQSLSESLLQLTQYESVHNHSTVKKISFNPLIEQSVHRTQNIAKKKHISILHENEDIAFEGDMDSLINLFVILIENAIKYSPEHTIIKIECAKQEPAVVVRVIDQGIGIAEHDKPHIFDRFYRADSARSKKTTAGYGLGLSIAKKIIAGHHGTLAVESTEHQGSTFIVRLPLKQNARLRFSKISV